MHTTLNKWLEELEDETRLYVLDEVNQEAQANMVAFGFNEALLNEWGKESVTAFLNACAKLYHRKGGGHNFVFYSWLDEQAAQIRISAVSQTHEKLPFSCKLNPTNLSQVVNGIYRGDSGLFTKGALDLWCQNI